MCFQTGKQPSFWERWGYAILIYTVPPPLPLPGVPFPSDFFHMDSHQAGRRGFRNGSLFGFGFPIGASSSPVGTRLCLQSLVCYTFAGQLLPSIVCVQSLTHNYNCMCKQKVPGGASQTQRTSRHFCCLAKVYKIPVPAAATPPGMPCGSVPSLFQIVPPYRLQCRLVRGFSAGN